MDNAELLKEILEPPITWRRGSGRKDHAIARIGVKDVPVHSAGGDLYREPRGDRCKVCLARVRDRRVARGIAMSFPYALTENQIRRSHPLLREEAVADEVLRFLHANELLFHENGNPERWWARHALRLAYGVPTFSMNTTYL